MLMRPRRQPPPRCDLEIAAAAGFCDTASVSDIDPLPPTPVAISTSTAPSTPLEALDDDDIRDLWKLTHTLSWTDGIIRVSYIVVLFVVFANEAAERWLFEHTMVTFVLSWSMWFAIHFERERRVRRLLRDTLRLDERDVKVLLRCAYALTRAERKQVRKAPLDIGRVVIARAIAARDGASR
jgi:hypothetical protein